MCVCVYNTPLVSGSHSDIRYWHRSLNPKKLVEVQFSAIHRHMTLQRMMRLYRLPDVRDRLQLSYVVFSMASHNLVVKLYLEGEI